MTTEELLQERFLVVADYPSNDEYKVGQVIENIGPNYSEMLSRYPHLFRKLEWWEQRKPEDMPQYVKADDGVFKVIRWEQRDQGMLMFLDEKTRWHVTNNTMCFYQPATEDEYTNYINSKQLK